MAAIRHVMLKFAKNRKMTPEEKSKPENLERNTAYAKNSLRQYGVYSAIVFQMLATMGLGFWGGKKLNDYFEVQGNLLTILIGLLGMGLAFYNLIKKLNSLQKNEK